MDLSKMLEIAANEIDKYSQELNEVSQAIWSKPELNFEEHSAHQVLCDFLEKRGFAVQRHFVLETGFKASFGDTDGGTKPHIVFICEYDALPGIGHACGHNLIAEVGIASGLGVKAVLEADSSFGKVTVLGTPAEEGGGGKIDMINANVFKDVDISMMSHPTPYDHSHPPALSISQLNIKFHGKASHAAGFPWEGINALDAAVLCYQNISCLRQQMKPKWRVHGVITNGGAKPNIIPDFTQLDYYCRAPSDSELGTLQEKIINCAKSASMATGCTVEHEFVNRSYSSLISNRTLVRLFEKYARKEGIDLLEGPDVPTGSTDMGNVSYVVPSIQPFFSIGTTAGNHTKDFTGASGSEVAQPYTLKQSKVLAYTALEMFRNPALIKEAKENFIEDLKTA